MAIDIAIYETIVLFFGLALMAIFYITVHIDFIREVKEVKGLVRKFFVRQITSATCVDSAITLYYILRLYQVNSGYHGYILIDIAVIIISTSLYFATYPFFSDMLRQLKSIYDLPEKDAEYR